MMNGASHELFNSKLRTCLDTGKRIIKAIVWDENGWIEIIKRLESPGTFRWPESEQEALSVSADELLATLKGHDIWRRLPVFEPLPCWLNDVL
jgi:hypothetical protein